MIDALFTFFGIVGSASFAVCGLPQVIKAYRTKSASDISYGFLCLSIAGNVFSAAYIAYSNVCSGMWQYPLYFNYGIALSLFCLLLAMKIRYR